MVINWLICCCEVFQYLNITSLYFQWLLPDTFINPSLKVLYFESKVSIVFKFLLPCTWSVNRGMITSNWHFLFKFKSNSRNNRRDKCVVLADLCTGQDHCHSWGASHGHVGLIFINISRQEHPVSECPSCQQLSSRKSESWYNLIQFTNPRTSRYSKFTTPLLWAANECRHQQPSLNEAWKDARSLSPSCIQAMDADTKVPGQHNFLIQYSLLEAIKFCGCRAVKASSLLSVTFVLSLEARLEDGWHWIIIVTWSVNSKMYLQL